MSVSSGSVLMTSSNWSGSNSVFKSSEPMGVRFSLSSSSDWVRCKLRSCVVKVGSSSAGVGGGALMLISPTAFIGVDVCSGEDGSSSLISSVITGVLGRLCTSAATINLRAAFVSAGSLSTCVGLSVWLTCVGPKPNLFTGRPLFVKLPSSEGFLIVLSVIWQCTNCLLVGRGSLLLLRRKFIGDLTKGLAIRGPGVLKPFGGILPFFPFSLY